MDKKRNYQIELWTGIKHKIPLCCIIFYESVWRPAIKNQIDAYSKTMSKLTQNQGTILCPDCLIDQINKNIIKKEIQKNSKRKLKILEKIN